MTQLVRQNHMPWPYGGASVWTGYPWRAIPPKYNTGMSSLVSHRRIGQYQRPMIVPRAGCTSDADCGTGKVFCTSAGSNVCCSASAGGCADPLCGLAVTTPIPKQPAPQGCPEGCLYRSDLKCCQGAGEKACQCTTKTLTASSPRPNPFYGYPVWGGYGYGYPYGYPRWGYPGFGYGYPYGYGYGYPGWGGCYPYWGGCGYHHGTHGGGTHPSSAHLITGPGGSTPVDGSSTSAVPNPPKPSLRKRMRRWFRKYF